MTWPNEKRMQMAISLLDGLRKSNIKGIKVNYNVETILTVLVAPESFLNVNMLNINTIGIVRVEDAWDTIRDDIMSMYPGQFTDEQLGIKKD